MLGILPAMATKQSAVTRPALLRQLFAAYQGLRRFPRRHCMLQRQGREAGIARFIRRCCGSGFAQILVKPIHSSGRRDHDVTSSEVKRRARSGRAMSERIIVIVAPYLHRQKDNRGWEAAPTVLLIYTAIAARTPLPRKRRSHNGAITTGKL